MTQPPAPNRRRFERVSLAENRRLACSALGEGLHLDGEVTVISTGGMFIHTAAVQPIGARFDIKMRNIADVVEADCVVRNNEREGFGVEFIDMRPKFRENLERIIERLRTPGT
ncbi:MAG: PilZ domain-containing protein [Acidobacteria bacterium]|nr:PilZ domain-containing protein [Acidobacteriota bacterium]